MGRGRKPSSASALRWLVGGWVRARQDVTLTATAASLGRKGAFYDVADIHVVAVASRNQSRQFASSEGQQDLAHGRALKIERAKNSRGIKHHSAEPAADGDQSQALCLCLGAVVGSARGIVRRN